MTIGAMIRRWTREDPRPNLDRQTMTAAARTHVGRVRTVNEDRFLVRCDRGLWAIADGMGGHTAGAAAATIAIEALDALADDAEPIDEMAIVDALCHANRAIHANAGGNAAISGATIVVVLADAEGMAIFWAGDSRAYRIRDGKADRLTHDHSLVQELIDAGVLSEAAAERHPQANVVTRALGVGAMVDIAKARVGFASGDRLVLCSDGVSRSLDARDFAAMSVPIDAAADRLLANALQRDGSDNATLIIVERAPGA